uniref:Leucine-rich PPR motif-containing protein, mitochondrial n=1 Tax=Cacopsylla melanoneura TaxID=428564 RepID=A0A8D8WCH4_9HEMI
MSLVLRTSHLARTLCTVSRKITLTARTQINFTLLPASSSCSNQISQFTLSQSFATRARPNVATIDNASPIDLSINKLDNDARKVGRVSIVDIKHILASLSRSNLPSSTQALMLIRCCGDLLPEEIPAIRTQLAQTLWQTFDKLNIQLDISHYNALLRVHLENEHTFSPTDFLAELETKRIEPNRVTYQRLVTKYCQDGNIDGATKILEFMRDKAFPISEGVFNALIFGHAQAKDMQSAEAILGTMSAAGLEPSAQTYTTLMCGYAKHGDMESLRRIMVQCEGGLVNGDYLDVVNALAVNGHEQYVDEIIGKIQPGVGYSADAANHIYQLVNKGQLETAYRVVKTLARSANINGEQLPVGGFLVRHMIKTNQPIDKVLAVCERLTDENLHPHAFNLAVQLAVEHASLDSLVVLLNEYKTRGGEVRPHYFWPVLVREGTEHNTAEVLRIIQVAEAQFQVGNSAETLRDYALPYLSPKNQVSGEVFAQLRGVGVSTGTLTTAYVGHMLAQGNLKEAARVAKSFRARYPKIIMRKLLTSAYIRTQDLESLMIVLRAVSENSPQQGEGDEAKEEGGHGGVSIDVAFNSGVLLDMFNAFKRSEGSLLHLEQVLKAFIEHGLAINRNAVDYIQNGLQSSLTSEISQALSTLTSEEMTPRPIQYVASMLIPKSQTLNPEYTLGNIKKLESQGENPSGLKRALLVHYIKEQDFDKATEYFKNLEADPSFTAGAGLYILMAGLSADVENLEAATQYLNQFKEKFPGEKADASRVLRVAYLQLKNGKEADMMELLRENARDTSEVTEFPSTAPSWRLLNLSAETTNPESTKKLFELLKNSNYIQANNVLLGALIKAHILKQDFTGALETFESCVNTYRATPWKNELMRHFIQIEDAASLQRITDLSTSVHGEVNSLYDLMMSFLDEGRLRQARKILETPGMRLRPERLIYILEYYANNSDFEKIENLLKVTQDIETFDRSAIYLTLVNLYSKNNEADKALALWTQMQEDNETPSDKFLHSLATLLRKNGREVPFAVPKQSVKVKEISIEEQKQKPKKVETKDGNMRSLIQSGNAAAAAKLYQNTKSDLSIMTRLLLIPFLLKNNLATEAAQVISDITPEQLENIRNPRRLGDILRDCTVTELTLLEPKLNEELKRNSLFSTYLMKAHLKADTIKAYLDQIKTDLTQAETNQDKLTSCVQKLGMGGLLATLDNRPDLLPQVSELAHAAAKAGLTLPIQALFNFYYINKQIPEAEQIFTQHLVNRENNIRYRAILSHVSRTKDLSLAEPLVNMVRQLNTPRTLSHVYYHLISSAVANEQLDAGLSLLKRAVDESATELIERTLVNKLQALATKQGNTVPLDLVNKIAFQSESNTSASSSSSSSSDSDEEVEKQKQEGK